MNLTTSRILFFAIAFLLTGCAQNHPQKIAQQFFPLNETTTTKELDNYIDHTEIIPVSEEDIALSANQEMILLLDNNAVKCLGINDSSLFFTVSPKIDVPLDALAPAEEKGFYLFRAFPATSDDYHSPKPMLFKVDSTGAVVCEYVPRKEIAFSIGNITQT